MRSRALLAPPCPPFPPQEPFGPVLPILRVDTPEQGVEHCNANRVALQGCVFTRDIEQAIRLSDAMETGSVQVGLSFRGSTAF